MAHTLLLLTVANIFFVGCHAIHRERTLVGVGGDCILPDMGPCQMDASSCDGSSAASQLALVMCPHACGLCTAEHTTTDAPVTTSQVATTVSVAVTTQSSASSGCFDRLSDDECNVVPNFCDDLYARLLCPKSCGFCCEDRVHGTTCEELAKEFPTLCTDHLGMEACAKYCGRCSSTSKPTA